MKKYLRKLLPFWPIASYAGIVCVLFFANYVPETFLTGWDNLHPEFNFAVNIKRSLFAVWQEYQSLGLLGGMGHASDLVHQLALFALSFILPMNLLRYVWTFLMLFLGSTGAYVFISYLFIKPRTHTLDAPSLAKNRGKLIPNTKYQILNTVIPFLGGLFYLLNLATLQTFYAPFEAFTAHFAALPWLLFASLKYWNNPTKKNAIILSIVLFLSTPAAYIPTLFVVYILALSILVFTSLIQKRTRASLASTIKLYAIIFIVNSFWLLPFAYFTLHNSSINLNSRINQMATENIFLQNKEFGDAGSVIALKGFWLNNVDPDRAGQLSYMMPEWRSWLERPEVTIIGYFLFSIILLGLFSQIKSRRLKVLPLVALFIFSFGVLATTTPPFSWGSEFVRNNIQILHQAFRFPFTKFSLLAGLIYSVFFAYGLTVLCALLTQLLKHISRYTAESRKHVSIGIITLFTLITLIGYMFPVFTGHLFYDKERVAIPKDYFELFSFFNDQDPNTRIANFPQYTFWGWSDYSWGYGGSGFLWYGIKQPILDRAFDVWSQTSENYYNELSSALYAQDSARFKSVLEKYDINWLLVDKNVINPYAPKALFTKELSHLLEQLPTVAKVRSFGALDVYRVQLPHASQKFVSAAQNLPTVNPYAWTDQDQAHNSLGSYVASVNPSLVYPFRSVFSNKTEKEQEYTVHDEGEFLSISHEFSSSKASSTLVVPALTDDILPSLLATHKTDSGDLVIELKIRTPEILVNNDYVVGFASEYPLFVIPSGLLSAPLTLNVNGIATFSVKNEEEIIGATFLSTKQNNSITLTDPVSGASEQQIVYSDSLQTLPVFEEREFELKNLHNTNVLTVRIPKIHDSYFGKDIALESFEPVKNCDRFRNGSAYGEKTASGLVFNAKNATACTSIYLDTLSHKQAYVVTTQSKNISGRPLHFWVLNEDEKYAPLDTYLPALTQRDEPASKELTGSTLFIPPMEPYGKGYSLHFENQSIGNDYVANELQKVGIYPVPSEFITSLAVKTGGTLLRSTDTPVSSVSHPHEGLYTLDIPASNKNQTIILSQSYDPGWKAYQVEIACPPEAIASGDCGRGKWKVENWLKNAFPFWFGTEIRDHVKVNNWENGWNLSNWELETTRPAALGEAGGNSKIVIVYLPQYLEYAGFLMLFLYADSLFDPFKKVRARIRGKIQKRFQKVPL